MIFDFSSRTNALDMVQVPVPRAKQRALLLARSTLPDRSLLWLLSVSLDGWAGFDFHCSLFSIGGSRREASSQGGFLQGEGRSQTGEAGVPHLCTGMKRFQSAPPLFLSYSPLVTVGRVDG